MQPYEKYLKENSQKLRVDQTDAERKLWQRINRDQLLGFRFNRQKPLLSYIVDFYCAKAKLIIELDGSQHYEPDYQEKDALRDAELNSLGFKALPICIAKTQYSFSDDSKRLGNPVNYSIHIEDISLKSGAGFIVVFSGKIIDMPGLPRTPNALNMKIDDLGNMNGLF